MCTIRWAAAVLCKSVIFLHNGATCLLTPFLSPSPCDAVALALASVAVSFLRVDTSCTRVQDESEKEERGAEDPELVKLLSVPRPPTPLLGVVLCGYLTNTTQTQRGTHLLRVPYPFEGLLKEAKLHQRPGTPPRPPWARFFWHFLPFG